MHAHAQNRNVNKEYTPTKQLKPTMKQKYTTYKLVSITFLFRECASHLFKIMKDTYLHCKGNPIICPLGQSCLSFFSAKAAGRNSSSHLISPAEISKTISMGKSWPGLASLQLVQDGHTYSVLACSLMCFMR